MPVEKIESGGLRPFELTTTGTRWYNGRTWHVTEGGRDEKVECYEVAWDEHGQGRATGNRKQMTYVEAAETQQVSTGSEAQVGVAPV